MQLCTTGELRRDAQLNKITGKKAGTADTSAKTRSPQRQEPADKLTLSRQALTFLEEQDRKRWEKAQEELQRKMDRSNEIISGLEDAKNQSDAMARALKVLLTCQRIAASIMKGNRVPPEDVEYLMENDPDGYKLAMALRRENPDPEDEKSVLEDEENESGSAEGVDGGGGAPEVSAPEASSGGGEASAAE